MQVDESGPDKLKDETTASNASDVSDIHPSLASIRSAWSKMGVEAKEHGDAIHGELEEYLRFALFRISGLTHKLRSSDELNARAARIQLACDLDIALQVCEQVCFYLLSCSRK